jgi:ADP-ribose pyrophosphatase YjhB (NUDIX family)
MPYIGSYVWKIRQKVGGGELLLLPAAEIIAERDGKFLMVFSKDFNVWSFPGGYAEVGQGYADTAIREFYEETGAVVEKRDLKIAVVSGKYVNKYPNGDKVQAFVCTFFTDKMRDESELIDKTEIGERGWFSPEEIDEMKLAVGTAASWEGFKKWKETGDVQVVETEDEMAI